MLSGLVLLAIICPLITSSPISSALRKCDALSDHLDACILANLNVIVPSLKSGWEWIDLPGIDPIELPKKLTPSYHDGNLTLDVVLSNTVLEGLADTKTLVVRSKAFSIGKLEVMTTTPSISYRGRYTSEGYTGIFPLHSSGTFNITLVDVNTAWIAYLSKLNDATHNYLMVDNLKLDAMPVQIFIDGAHMFDGSNEIANDVKTSLNANSIELYDLMKPILMNFMSAELRNYINVVLGTTPMEEMVSGLNMRDWKKR